MKKIIFSLFSLALLLSLSAAEEGNGPRIPVMPECWNECRNAGGSVSHCERRCDTYVWIFGD